MNRRTIEQLAEDDKGMWLLRVYGGYALEKIAQMYGTTRANVHARLESHYEHVSQGVKSFNSFDE